jgi:hypothetical protein
MPEKDLTQRKVAPKDAQAEGGKSLHPPTFQLKAGEADAKSSLQQVAQKKAPKGEKAAEKQKVTQGPGYQQYTSASAIVTIPDGAQGNLPILTIFGGMHYANKEWMMKQVPANLFSSHIISFANYTTYYTSSVKPNIEAAMATSKVSGTYKALLGFSAGGARVEGAMGDESWSVLGMIDAVAGHNKSYPAKVLHIYNIWGDNTEANDARHLLHLRIKKGEVAGESFRDKGHESMPAKWFAAYGGML